MKLPNSHYRRPAGFGLFDLLCFVAACSLIFPIAIGVSRHFEGHKRLAVFFLFMLIVYPVVGFIFACLLRRLFRYWHNKSTKYPDRYND